LACPDRSSQTEKVSKLAGLRNGPQYKILNILSLYISGPTLLLRTEQTQSGGVWRQQWAAGCSQTLVVLPAYLLVDRQNPNQRARERRTFSGLNVPACADLIRSSASWMRLRIAAAAASGLPAVIASATFL